MANSTNNILATQATANNTSRVSPATTIPSNCHTILVFNPDTTNSVLLAEGTASGVALPVSTSMLVPPNSSVTLGIGIQSLRASPFAELVYSTSAGSINVNITYICTNKNR